MDDRWSIADQDLVGIPDVCILAGGLGTRLGERSRGLPKPLVTVNGKPFLLHQLRLLADCSVRRVVLCVGYKGELIERAIGSRQYGIDLVYSYDGSSAAGTLGAIRLAQDLLGSRFLIMYGDTYLEIDYCSVVGEWSASGLPAMMTVLQNDGRWGMSNVVYRNGRVLKYDKTRPTRSMRWIDYGLLGMSKCMLSTAPPESSDLADLQSVLASHGLICGIEVSRRYHEIGTPDALDEAEEYIRNKFGR